jgi:hypothetical protein
MAIMVPTASNVRIRAAVSLVATEAYATAS